MPTPDEEKKRMKQTHASLFLIGLVLFIASFFMKALLLVFLVVGFLVMVIAVVSYFYRLNYMKSMKRRSI